MSSVMLTCVVDNNMLTSISLIRSQYFCKVLVYVEVIYLYAPTTEQ